MLERAFEAEGSNQKWVADFTFILTAQGWLYVAVVIDLLQRKNCMVGEMIYKTGDTAQCFDGFVLVA